MLSDYSEETRVSAVDILVYSYAVSVTVEYGVESVHVAERYEVLLCKSIDIVHSLTFNADDYIGIKVDVDIVEEIELVDSVIYFREFVTVVDVEFEVREYDYSVRILTESLEVGSERILSVNVLELAFLESSRVACGFCARIDGNVKSRRGKIADGVVIVVFPRNIEFLIYYGSEFVDSGQIILRSQFQRERIGLYEPRSRDIERLGIFEVHSDGFVRYRLILEIYRYSSALYSLFRRTAASAELERLLNKSAALGVEYVRDGSVSSRKSRRLISVCRSLRRNIRGIGHISAADSTVDIYYDTVIRSVVIVYETYRYALHTVVTCDNASVDVQHCGKYVSLLKRAVSRIDIASIHIYYEARSDLLSAYNTVYVSIDVIYDTRRVDSDRSRFRNILSQRICAPVDSRTSYITVTFCRNTRKDSVIVLRRNIVYVSDYIGYYIIIYTDYAADFRSDYITADGYGRVDRRVETYYSSRSVLGVESCDTARSYFTFYIRISRNVRVSAVYPSVINARYRACVVSDDRAEDSIVARQRYAAQRDNAVNSVDTGYNAYAFEFSIILSRLYSTVIRNVDVTDNTVILSYEQCRIFFRSFDIRPYFYIDVLNSSACVNSVEYRLSAYAFYARRTDSVIAAFEYMYEIVYRFPCGIVFFRNNEIVDELELKTSYYTSREKTYRSQIS